MAALKQGEDLKGRRLFKKPTGSDPENPARPKALHPIKVIGVQRPDARAWLLWVAVMASLIILIRNPLYTAILLLAVLTIRAAWSQSAATLRLPLWRLALFIVGFSALFNALAVHVGQTVLFRLPSEWPIIGGAVTLEGFIFGASNGLILLALLALFVALNDLVASHALVRLVPRALHDLGLVLLIAMTYVPETIQQFRQIRDAQAIRGHRLRGVRDWQPVIVPLLVGGLERALSLAEAMVARGYGATADVVQAAPIRIGLTLSLLLALAGWLLSFSFGWPGWLLLALGSVLFLVLLWWRGRGMRRTHYLPAAWTMSETVIVASALLPLMLLLLAASERSALNYNPYPLATIPPFDPLVGLALASLALPSLLTSGHDRD